MRPLLNEFLEEELRGFDRSEFIALFRFDDGLKEEITLHFNRFNVFVRHQLCEIVIEDDLNISSPAECTISFPEFHEAVRAFET